MHEFAFVPRENQLPEAADSALLALGMERWLDAATEADDDIASFVRTVASDRLGRRLLASVFGNSPFLTLACVREPEFVRSLLTAGPDRAYAHIIEDLAPTPAGAPDESTATVMRRLRVAKRRVALTVAVADIAGLWSLEQVTGALSDFADGALRCACRHLLLEGNRGNAYRLPHADDPERNSGLIVLAMGKLGSRELNYSSDIDLIVLYDPDRIHTDDADGLQNHFIRLVRALVRLIDERTRDGYVFRTDLRLRPDPGATPLALSVLAAETYYESQGQNWERAAMIKARPVAGDRAAGRDFLDRLRPYVWRRNLDFAAIQDIHSIKRQINAYHGSGTIAVGGHDIKLGRGGIREIEFFAQTQQLIWGGREPRLRVAGTVAALEALVACDLLRRTVADDMAAAYRFLRRVEHRLQMIDDDQTQTMPRDPGRLRQLAVFLGYEGAVAFSRDLLRHLQLVEGHYRDLFGDAPSLGARDGARAGREAELRGNLVFTGSEPDPDTLETLRSLGYANPEIVDAAVRKWHHGRYRATRSTRAREILTELMPVLVESLAAPPDADAAFIKFDEFLSRLPAGVQLFSMFQVNPGLLRLIAEIMGEAPRLAAHLSRNPQVLDSVLTPGFMDPPPPLGPLQDELDSLLDRASGTEEVLDLSRRWANDRRFQVGVQILRGVIEPPRAARVLSNIAETVLRGLYPLVQRDFADQHGRIADAGMVTLALGKLGGHEMTPASDLDLIFVYSVPDGVEASDGPRPLPPSLYFARLAKRLINAVTALTAEGRLYEVDMRLRPSGGAGPIACSDDAFFHYHDEAAWTWEHMALTRARPISGRRALRRRMRARIREVLCRERDPDALLLDVADMRARMDAEHKSDFVWDIRYLRGGLLDLEFIVQSLQLRHAHAHPEILSTNAWKALNNLAEARLLAASHAETLLHAVDLWQALQTILHLTIEGDLGRGREGEVPAALQIHLAKLGGAIDFAEVEEKIRDTAARVYEVFRSLIEEPAARQSARSPSREARKEAGR